MFDLPLEQLESYRPEVQCPPDLRDFWTAQVAAARATADGP
ncbi:MAG: acetylxylan esterase, partial [Promicromonosporaceae bacterium]|nr:acetylxylan esterase [Promicromonosporaceae bacterium]